MKCSGCGNEIPEGAKFCAECGVAVKREQFCRDCGYQLMPEQKFCPQCGAQIQKENTFSKMSVRRENRKSQNGDKEKFKSNVVVKALKAVPGNVIDEQMALDIAKIVNIHALGSAASSAATAWMPGAGAGIATAGAIGFIWSMYVRISDRLGIKLSKKKLKFLGSAILSNLASAGGALLAASAISLIPGIGSVTAVVLTAGANYALVTVAGILYINLMSSLCTEGTDVSALSDEELKERMEKVMEGQNIKKMMKEAQGEYVKARKEGIVSGEETVELEEE
ncbi:MAG: zinc ribbon domain-containing protein [Blautia sp.]|nr:zinc ribbon domain-containing protein [Lachnoclostridium sp.]MCM1212835.1 zinc ribbon domain-containing protein [Blautia sp.]